MRAFLALPVRPPADRPVAALVDGLRARVAGVCWVSTATTHVTLHFFADLPTERLASVVGAVGESLSDQPAAVLRPRELGSFPAGRRARVLWLGVEDSAALNLLAARVQSAVASCGFAPEERPFRAHVTLGRPGPRFDRAAWLSELERQPGIPEFIADRVVLYESRGGHHEREVFALDAPSRAAVP